jgi:hypothetical protein
MIIATIVQLAENNQQRDLFGLEGFKLAEGHTAEKYSQGICNSIESSIRKTMVN